MVCGWVVAAHGWFFGYGRQGFVFAAGGEDQRQEHDREGDHREPYVGGVSEVRSEEDDAGWSGGDEPAGSPAPHVGRHGVLLVMLRVPVNPFSHPLVVVVHRGVCFARLGLC